MTGYPIEYYAPTAASPDMPCQWIICLPDGQRLTFYLVAA